MINPQIIGLQTIQKCCEIMEITPKTTKHVTHALQNSKNTTKKTPKNN